MKNLLPLTFLLFIFFNGYSQTNSIINQVTDCDTNCSDLTINFEPYNETTAYEVVSIPFNPPSNFTDLSNPLFVNTDDIWSGAIDLPFNFNFFGTNYDQLVVGSNGVLSFDVSNANTGNGWAFSESLPNNTNPTLSEGNIFGAGHDIDPAASNGTHEIGWEIQGAAPFRVFVLSYYNVAHFSCNNLKTTQMIALYETTNVIDVYILDKPVCGTWNNGHAVIGVQNNAGTIAYVPEGRNTGSWNAQVEAWRFNPSGPSIDNVYSWYDNNDVLISNSASINVCPEETSQYNAFLEYYNVTLNSFETIEESVTLYVDILLGSPEPLIKCDYLNANDGFELFDLTFANNNILNGNDASDFSITYYETQADADSASNPLPSNYYNTTPYQQTIFVRVESLNSNCYSEVLPLDLEVQYCPIACGEFANISYCYTDNDTTEFLFSSADGTPLTVVFNTGQVEDESDMLLIIDSDGSSNLNEATPYGNNGDLTGLTFTSSGSSILVKISADSTASCESENYTPWNFDVYCADSVGLIKVNAFSDSNGDSVFNANESLFSHGVFTYEVNDDSVIHNITSSSGSFVIPNFEENNSYDVGFVLNDEYQDCLNQTITFIENVSVIEGETEILDFPVTEITECFDIGIYLIPYIPPRPGLLQHVGLLIENNSNIAVSGTLVFTHDDLVTLEGVYFVDSGNSVTNTSNGFILSFDNFAPNQQDYIEVRLSIPTALNIGDYLTHFINYSETDLDLGNNSFTLTEEVVNSYDPNDKAESHGGKILIDDFTESDYLFYTIRFQNLGNADALNIRIEDVLDSQLDASTFKMLSASHEYTLTRIDNELVWQFSNVNLPPESEDEAGSNGFVLFKVKPNSGFEVGDIIPNTADIYFDFNPAITTNTFETEFVNNLSVTEFDSSQFSIYPNPANDFLNVNMSNQIVSQLSVAIYDIQGKLISDELYKTDTTNFQIDVSYLSTGLYVIKLYNEEFQEIKKLIIN